MRHRVLCSDYDGTLADHGTVSDAAVAALERLIASGRKAVLVTGRVIEELLALCPRIDLFECVVAENGALLYWPAESREQVLAAAPPPDFLAALRAAGLPQVSAGRVIVAGWRPHEERILQTIRDMGLDLRVIFNKDAVMVLPAGVDKAFGLRHALQALGIEAREAIAVGDAENDLDLLALCGCGAAVANALPAVKQAADLVVPGERGAGVVQLIDALLAGELARYARPAS